ncbi:ATP-dependent metallopeptidase FtsH/Yme1/Tma family protein [Staphylococcus aureus]
MQKAFRNVLVIVIIGVIIFGLFSYLNGNGNMPKQLADNQFTEKLEKGDLKIFRNPTTTKCLYGKW